MGLFILGLSHRTAPLEVREKVAFDSEQLPRALDALKASGGVSESIILSTCNRTELYLDLAEPSQAEPLGWLARYRDLGLPEIEPHVYRLSDAHAVRHVLRVASGLDSLVLGEPQILGQLKDAYRAALGAGTVGKLLNRLMQFSFSTAKLIRSETEIGASPVSVAFAAVKLAQQIHGDLGARRALLVGAGETISLVANHLAGAGIGHLVIANRSHERAVDLAARYGGEAIAITELREHLPRADIVVCSTASRLPIVTRDFVELALKKRGHDPMFLVDLAVPRDVEPAVGELDDAYLYTVDDLESVVAANLRGRSDAAAEAEEMVHLRVQDYMDWLQVQSSSATITAFRARGEAIRNAALSRALARIDNGEEPRAVLEHLAHTLTNKLLHHPTTSLRAAGGREDYLAVARELLGLGDDDSQR